MLMIESIRFDARQLLEHIADSMVLTVSKKNIDLILDIEPNMPTQLVGGSGTACGRLCWPTC